MTDGQSLLLVFVALYIFECLRWLPAQSYLLLGSGTRWHSHRPFQPIELGGRCPALLSLLPPLQSHLVTLPWQFIPAEAGLELHLDARPPQLLPWAAVQTRVEGRNLYLSPELRVSCLHESHARQIKELIQAWLPMPQAERETDFLRYAKKTLDGHALTAQAKALSAQTGRLRHLGSLIFLWTFVILASLYRWLGESTLILWVAAGMFGLQLVQTWFFYRRAKGVTFRFWKALVVAIMPQHAMRAADLLADKPTETPAHPLAARALIGDEVWRKQALQFWKTARYQPNLTADLQSRALEAFLKKQGLPTSELDAPPTREEGTSVYCPKCHAQFQAGATQCQDCGGVPLKAF